MKTRTRQLINGQWVSEVKLHWWNKWQYLSSPLTMYRWENNAYAGDFLDSKILAEERLKEFLISDKNPNSVISRAMRGESK